MSAAVGSPWRRWRGRAALVVVVAILLTAGYFARQLTLVGNGYVAKTMCSAVYVSGRKPQAVRDAEIRLNDPGILRLASADVERSSRTVRSAFLGLGERVAVYRDGLGCTLALGVGPGELSSRGLPANVAALPARGTPWAVFLRVSELPFLKRSACASQPNDAYRTSLAPHATRTGTLTFPTLAACFWIVSIRE